MRVLILYGCTCADQGTEEHGGRLFCLCCGCECYPVEEVNDNEGEG